MIDFGLMNVGQLEALLSALQGFNLADMASNLALTATAHGVTPPGAELASVEATTALQKQVAEMDAMCMLSGANVLAYLSVSQANKAGAVATDMATAAPFGAV